MGIEWIIFGLLGSGMLGGVIYLPARHEWNDTFTGVRDRMRSQIRAKNAVALSKNNTKAILNKQAIADWDSQYTGSTALVVIDPSVHGIVKSWEKLEEHHYDGYQQRWYWECLCGKSDYHLDKNKAKIQARSHIVLMDGRNEEGIRAEGWLTKL